MFVLWVGPRYTWVKNIWIQFSEMLFHCLFYLSVLRPHHHHQPTISLSFSLLLSSSLSSLYLSLSPLSLCTIHIKPDPISVILFFSYLNCSFLTTTRISLDLIYSVEKSVTAISYYYKGGVFLPPKSVASL